MDIYQPAEDSYLLQRYVKKHAFGRVLDLGTGSGIQALTAAECKVVKEVVAVDINEQAVERLKKEVLSNKLKTKIKANDSDLFSNVQGKFDTILFNPPYLPEDKIGKEIVEDSALYGGKHGWELSEKFFNLVSKYLVASGKILFLDYLRQNEPIFKIYAQTDLIEQQAGKVPKREIDFELFKEQLAGYGALK